MLHEELRNLRTQRKLTQKEVAEQLGIDRTTYTSYETGKVKPPLRTLQRLSIIYHVPVSRLTSLSELAQIARFPTASLANGDGLFDVNMEEEFALLMCYRTLTAEGKQQLFDLIQTLPKKSALEDADEEEDEQ